MYELVIGVVVATLCGVVGYLKVSNKGLYTTVKTLAYAIEFTHKILKRIDNKMMEMFLTRYFKMTKNQQEKLCKNVYSCLNFVSDNMEELKEELNITDDQVEKDVDAFVDTLERVKDEVDVAKDAIDKLQKDIKDGLDDEQ